MDMQFLMPGMIVRSGEAFFKLERPLCGGQRVLWLATSVEGGDAVLTAPTMADYLQQHGPMTVPQLKKVLKPIVAIVQDLPKDIIGFDITPDNILLVETDDGQVPMVLIYGSQLEGANAVRSLKATKEIALGAATMSQDLADDNIEIVPYDAADTDVPSEPDEDAPAELEEIDDDFDAVPDADADEPVSAIQANRSHAAQADDSQQSKLGAGWIIALWLAIFVIIGSVAFYFYNRHSKAERAARASMEQVETPPQPDSDGYIHGKPYVDLGLSVLWANSNLGADNPEQLGEYFSWGDEASKSYYSDGNTEAMNQSIEALAQNGITTNGALNSTCDPAANLWGGTWRLPTKAEADELIKKCQWTWEGQGYRVTGPNGNSIFLPTAGLKMGTTYNYRGRRGHYWTSTPHAQAADAYLLYFSDHDRKVAAYKRSRGCSVRPVAPHIEQ